MPTLRKTDIDKMAPGSWLWDDKVRGLGLRKQRRDAIWVLRYTWQGEQRRRTLGSPLRGMTIELARREANRRLGILATGGDPFAEPKADLTLGDIINPPEGKKGYLDFIEAEGLRPHSIVETTRSLKQHWKPLHRTKLRALDRLAIGETIDQIAVERGPAAAVRSRSSLSSCLAWAVRKGYIDVNPVVQTFSPSEGEKERTRVLTEDELRRLWLACDPETPFGRIVRLLVLTGCRRQEIGSLRWDEFAADLSSFTIPKERSKNKQALTLPLLPAMQDLLPERGRSPWLFARRAGFNVWKYAGPLWRKAKIEDACLHDIRRTVASMMRKRLGIAPHVIAECLNHTLGTAHGVGGSTGIYIRERDEKAMREALVAWANYVLLLVTGDPKVTPAAA
jgi:integrase